MTPSHRRRRRVRKSLSAALSGLCVSKTGCLADRSGLCMKHSKRILRRDGASSVGIVISRAGPRCGSTGIIRKS